MKKTLVLLLLVVLIASQSPSSQARLTSGGERNIGTCAKFTSDRQSCLECVPHYHLFEGQCYIDIHGCSQYVFGNICRKCQNGFILVNNECCDKHCMARIFKNYQAANEQSELTEQQKVERRITEGYEKTVESLTIFRYQFVKFTLQSTSNQVLQGYIRYFIKISANDKPYRCIADFQISSKKVFVIEFRLQSEMASIKQNILSQQDVVSNDQARVALQYTSGKFGLRTYGSSLERVSVTPYKYGSQFKLIYVGSQSALIIHVVVPSGGNKKQSPYSPWSQDRKDVKAIKTFVEKSMTVVKMKNNSDMQIIKQKVGQSNNIKTNQVEMKTIEKVRQNVYKYTFVNEQTKQVFEQISKIDPKTKKVEIVQHKEVISKDVKNMKLPESPEKKIIPKQQIPQTPEIKVAIKYLEEVQPSLATKQITNAAVQTIGQNKKITLIQKKNDQTSRVVILQNERTSDIKLIDESPVVTTPPTQTIYTTSPQGKPKIVTTDVQKFKKIDTQVEKVISTIEKKLPSINTTNIQSFEKTEGNLVNTYQVVVKQDRPQLPKQQVTVVQNTQTKQVKIIDVKQIKAPQIIEPVKRQPTPIPEAEFKTPQVKSIIVELQKTKPELKETEVTIKKAEVQEAKFVNQYTLVVETTKGQTLTIKANKPHDEKLPEITTVKPVYEKPTEKPRQQVPYVSKVTVDQTTGVKTVTTTKKEDIQTSHVTKVLSQITSTKVQPKVEQIQSVVTKQFEKTIVQTVVIKEQQKFVQVTVEQNKQTGQVRKVNEQVVIIQVKKSEPVLPVISTTQISETTFNQVVKVNQVLKNITETVVQQKPVFKNVVPITTEVEERGPVQVVTFVYEDKKTNTKERVVTQYNEQTKKTVIREQTTLPKVIEKVTFEKDITPQGETKIVSNKVEQIRKEDTHITKVIEQVSQKFPVVKQNSVKFEVVSNQLTNTYQITAVEPRTKDTVTVSVSFNKQTEKVTISDIQQSPKSELVVPKPIPRPNVVLKPEELTKPEVKQVVNFVSKVVNVEQVKQVKQVKNTISTSYEVTTQTTEGTKTVTVVSNNANPSDITLIDITSPTQTPSSPAPAPAPLTPSYTTVSVNSANVKDTTTNEKTLVSSNKYLKIVSEEAARKQPRLQNQNIQCYSEEVYDETVYISYVAYVGSKPTQGLVGFARPRRVFVSGFVWTQSSRVELVQVPSQVDGLLTETQIVECTQRKTTITTLNEQSIKTSSTSKQVGGYVRYVTSQFAPDTVDRLIFEKFSTRVKYVGIVSIRRKPQRVVLVFNTQTSQFTVIEQPAPVQQTKPLILQQRTQTDGTITTTSNTIEQVKTVDSQVQKFVQTLTKQVPVDTTQITNVISKQNTNTNQYTLVVRNEQTKTTSQIKAVFKKDDQTVIVTQVKEQPQVLIAPVVRPQTVISKEQYTSTTIQKVIQQVNVNKKVPNITTEKIVEIKVTKGTVTNNYEIVTQTTKGKQTIVVSESPKGQLTVIDYKPAQKPQPTVQEPSKTQITVNKVTGYETQVTNDVKVIRESKPIQSVVTKIRQTQETQKNVEVISAVTKTTDSKVQTTVVLKSQQRPEQRTVVVSFVDKQTQQVTIIAQKTVQTTEQQTTEIQQQVVLTEYTQTVIQKTIKQNKVLERIVKKVQQNHREVVQQTIPTQVVMEKINDKIISTVTYEGVHTSTVVYDETTEEVEEITYQVAPTNVKELVYETEKTVQGSTIITTNSVQKIQQVSKNFNTIISQIKQTIPSIQTEKIQAIKFVQPENPEAPQKIVVVFQTQKETQRSQIAVISEPKNPKPIIIDVQTILQEEIVLKPEPVKQVKLSQQEIKTQRVEEIIQQNLPSLPIKQVKKIVDVHEVKTAYSKTLQVKVQDTKGQTYVIKTQQIGNEQPTISDFAQVPKTKVPEIFTITSTNPKNGIISTYTNDLKVMSDEKTFSKVIDVLEKQSSLTVNGFSVDSQTVSRFQRSVEHHLRFVNKETNQGIDYRVIVDSRTGQVSINEQEKFTLTGQSSTVPAQKQYLEIPKSQLPEAMKKYSFIQSSLDVLRKADYTYESKLPDLTQVKQYKSITSSSSTGSNAVEVVMTFPVTIGGSNRKTRVVFLGEQKQTNKGYIMKIIDITTLQQNIVKVETTSRVDELNRKIIQTTDIKTLQKNSVEYTRVIEQVKEQIPSLSSSEVSSVTIKQLKNVNEYTMIVKKGSEVIQTKATFNKNTESVVISDFKTQSSKSQVEKVPIRQIQSIVVQVPKDKLNTEQYTVLRQEIIRQKSLPETLQITSVKVEQNPKIDSYTIRVVHSSTVEGTVTAIKNNNQWTIIEYKPDQPVQQEPVRTKDSVTEIKFDSITGSQTVVTNDVKVIKQTSSIQNVLKKVVQQKTVSKTSQVVSAVTKTSQQKIQTTVVIRQPSRPKQKRVVVTIADKKQPTKVQIISTQIFEQVTEIQTINQQEIVEETVITQIVYQTVIKKDTHLQKIVKQVERKYEEVRNITPVRVVMQEVGKTTISEITYETKKVTVVTNQQQQVVKTYEQPIPKDITPGTVQTSITKQGTKTVTSTSAVLMEKVQPTFKTVLTEITKDVKKQTIKTVVSEQKAFGTVYTVISQAPKQPEPQQTTYYYNKQTKQVTTLQTQQISVTNTVQSVTQPEPSRTIPQTKWETVEVKSVIQEVTNVVQQQKVLKVEELKSAPTVKFFQVTVETVKGPEVVKVTVDKTTKEVQVIEQTQQVTVVPQVPTTPEKPQQPTFTVVKVDQTTGVKTTFTTDVQVIKKDVTTTKVFEKITKQIPELRNTQIISTTTKNYEKTLEQRVVLKSEKTTTEVITLVDKQTQKVTIVDRAPVEPTKVTQQTITEQISQVTQTNEFKVSQTTFSQVYDSNDLLRRATEFVQTQLPRFRPEKPTSVNIEEVTTRVTKFTFVFTVSNIPYRVVVIYTKQTNTFSLVQQPSQVPQITKPIVLQTSTTTQGRKTIFTNDIESLTKQDTKFTQVFEDLTKQVTIRTEDLASIQSTQTSIGNSYTIVTKKGTEQNQIDVVYNEKTKEVKIVNMETVKETVPSSPPKITIIVPKEQYQSQEIQYVVERSIADYSIPKFTTTTDVSQITRTTTLFGRSYQFDINTSDGPAELISTITITSSSSPSTSPSGPAPRPSSVSQSRIVTVISYKGPAPKSKPQLITEAPSTTQFSVDVVTGTKIQTTNDVKVIQESKVVQNVVSELVKSSVISKDSQVVSTVTKTLVDNVQTTMVVKTSQTESKVVVTSTDKKTNQVTILAQKPVPREQIQQVDITKLVPQTVISSTIYEQVIKKDTTLQTVVKEVVQNHPEVKEVKPTRVTIDRVGEKTVTEVSYKDTSYTVVTDVKTGKTEEVTYSVLPAPEQRKPVVVEQRITEQGTKIVTSNKIQQIQKIVPTVRPAIVEVTKLIPIKTQQIKTITSSVEQKQYTVVTVDKTDKVKQIKFTYNPEAPKPIKLLDVQEFSEPSVPTKPKEIVFEPVKISEEPQIVKAIEKVNKTSTVIKNDVTEIVKVEKAVTNFVEEYKVQVKTTKDQQATIVFQVNPSTKQTVVVDVIRYQPQTQQPKQVVVEEKIDPVTQTRQTVFPTVETYKHDQTYTKVTEYLQNEITKGYEIVSVVKQNYGENKQISVLLKSQDKSPQQVQLNINEFNNEVTVLQNKTITSQESETSILTQDQPKPIELKLSPVDQEKFDILSKLQNVKQDEQYKTVPEVKTLEKNELFVKADEYLKTQFQSVLEQSNVVHVAAKQTLDAEQYKVYYVNTQNNDKEVYEAQVKINPITQTFDVQSFSKVGTPNPEKSKLNIDADIAYGYEPLENFSNDKNVKFVVQYAKKNYPTLANAVIQSVEVLGLCNQRFNYKIFFKNGLEVLKYIIYFEEAFQRVIVLAGKQFSFGGGNYETMNKDQLLVQGYFKNLNQHLKEKNSQIAEGSDIVFAERQDNGIFYDYRIIYSKNGKTYHAEGVVNKDNMAMQVRHFTQIIEVPTSSQQSQEQLSLSSQSDHYAVLRINDLAHNSNFEKVYREVLSTYGAQLQSTQLLGATQQSSMFKKQYKIFFSDKQITYTVSAQIDALSKKVTILTELQKLNIQTGFSVENNSAESQQIISWAQKSNPDLKSGAIVEVSSKKEIFGRIYKLVFKLQTKYFIMTVYKEGNDLKLLNQIESTTIDGSNSSSSAVLPNSYRLVKK